MAWVQVGPHKINTALVCYAEQDGETVRIYFYGEWEGNPLDLHFDEAKAFWKHLKAEDVLMSRDKGSAAVLPKLGSSASSSASSSSMYDVDPGGDRQEKPKPSSHTPHRPTDSHKHSDHRKH